MQFGSYRSSNNTPTNWPITFNKVFMCVGNVCGNYATGFYGQYFPYNLTVTGFSHLKAYDYYISYISIGC